jgi:pimeloyl-ACP methyl ester carboxylesterase
VTADTLVLWGKQDALMPPVYGERWIQLIAGARLAQIDNAGHMVPYEQPKAFASLVASFLD